jgi:hypothetical protein
MCLINTISVFAQGIAMVLDLYFKEIRFQNSIAIPKQVSLIENSATTLNAIRR